MHITIDEQFFTTKSSCRFYHSVCQKSWKKFDIKFWMAVVSETTYILNVIPYLGKDKTGAHLQRLFD